MTVVIDMLNRKFFEVSAEYGFVMSGSTVVLALLIDLEVYLFNLGDSGAMIVGAKKC